MGKGDRVADTGDDLNRISEGQVGFVQRCAIGAAQNQEVGAGVMGRQDRRVLQGAACLRGGGGPFREGAHRHRARWAILTGEDGGAIVAIVLAEDGVVVRLDIVPRRQRAGAWRTVRSLTWWSPSGVRVIVRIQIGPWANGGHRHHGRH
jgi:hypothetical protein